MSTESDAAAAPHLLTSVIASSSTTSRLRRADSRPPLSSTHDANAPGVVRPPAAPKIHVVDHPVAQHALTVLRNKHTPADRFRLCCNQLLALLAWEATRTLPTREAEIETPGATYVGRALARPVVLLSLSRNGLGLAHNLADFLPGAAIGAVCLERGDDGQPPEAHLRLVTAPALGDARVFLFDPVVSGGLSAVLALNLLRRSGASDLALLSFLISAPGLESVKTAVPDLTVWTAAIDPEWDPKRGTLPGMGNFVQRLYG